MITIPNFSHYKKPLTPHIILKFQNHILDFYSTNKRDFAWRQTTDPYKILVSEIMLQQTQTARVTTYYKNFLNTFPTVKALANASLKDVLTLWQGLGYNRRAKHLHTSAGEIVERFDGHIPSTNLDLQGLGGIGPNTAGAIMAYAFNQPITFIETNIRSVYLHTFYRNFENISDKELLPLIEQTVDINNPRDWYYALTDYGVYIKSQIVNPSRKSKHYAKQSKFKGSQRQIRAAIVRYLVQNDTATKTQLYSLPFDNKDIDANLKKLISEKMVTGNGLVFTVQ
ncbi:A/G-specific adenine glycosylase [bacterium]|uniref:Endonuclease III n=2 Tax=Katanobacteria TaxID=422282 RepID=A0A2M7X101_UNCKA|nr:A/G-specific adenine glycosylase [bacterium]PIP56056.1 MAG: endonuclease III [candidate division WWE3 bacterium CG22_combo_CG10-13_8_21_14_all_39_12]PJA39856.1 MAG: endonuclease III [candidate division WWE3 bacterium CG_4_9_14_3_um_filter_39_7]